MATDGLPTAAEDDSQILLKAAEGKVWKSEMPGVQTWTR